MTEAQYKKYKKLKEEISQIKNFLYWCGDKYKNQAITKRIFSFFRNEKKMLLYERDGYYPKESNTYEIPSELQERIIKVIEDYVDEKEKEMEEI